MFQEKAIVEVASGLQTMLGITPDQATIVLGYYMTEVGVIDNPKVIVDKLYTLAKSNLARLSNRQRLMLWHAGLIKRVKAPLTPAFPKGLPCPCNSGEIFGECCLVWLPVKMVVLYEG